MFQIESGAKDKDEKVLIKMIKEYYKSIKETAILCQNLMKLDKSLTEE